ncbi:MAG: lysophospholipid acyltransferase family protein [Jatrophihabitantaceae bacterium]
MLYWFLKFVALGPLLRGVWRPYVEGAENVPAHGGAILASNHLSFCDSFFMPVMVKRRVTFLAKAEYFTTGGLKGRLSRLFFAGVGQVPIDRDDADASRGALTTGVRILRRGDLLGIYPEGTRSPDGRLYKGKTGVARMALEAGVPVIPVAMIDTEKMMPTGRKLPHLRPRPGVRFGKPLDFSRYEGLAGDRFVERSMTDEIMYELMQLSGQEYVDTYAAKVKLQTGADLGFGARKGLSHADAVGSTRDDRLPTERAS